MCFCPPNYRAAAVDFSDIPQRIVMSGRQQKTRWRAAPRCGPALQVDSRVQHMAYGLRHRLCNQAGFDDCASSLVAETRSPRMTSMSKAKVPDHGGACQIMFAFRLSIYSSSFLLDLRH